MKNKLMVLLTTSFICLALLVTGFYMGFYKQNNFEVNAEQPQMEEPLAENPMLYNGWTFLFNSSYKSGLKTIIVTNNSSYDDSNFLETSVFNSPVASTNNYGNSCNANLDKCKAITAYIVGEANNYTCYIYCSAAAPNNNIIAPPISQSLFSGFANLERIVFDNFYTNDVGYMGGMFKNNPNLQSINFGSNFSTNNVSDMSNMFSGDTNLQTLNLSNFVVKSGANTTDMLSGCTSLTNIIAPQTISSDIVLPASYYDGTTPVTTLTSAHVGKSITSAAQEGGGGGGEVPSTGVDITDTSAMYIAIGFLIVCALAYVYSVKFKKNNN